MEQTLSEQFAGTDYEEAVQKLEAENAARASAEANKILKKNKREITRLKEWIYEAVAKGNYPAYDYALRKLRGIYRQPVTDELVLTMYETTRQQIRDIIHAGTN